MSSVRINLPPLTRALFLVVLAFSSLNAALRYRKWSAGNDPSAGVYFFTDRRWAIPYLALIPPESIWYPWTFLTAALFENNVVSLVISGAVIWFCGRYLERAWGGPEFAKFTLFVTMLPNIAAYFVYTMWYFLTKTPEFPTPIQGLLALEAGFLVALKQLVPEHTVSLLKGSIRVRVKHFPALFTLANIISGPLLGTDTAFWLSLFGFLTSWIYLRFLRISEAGEGSSGTVLVKGDASDTFAFVAFFPDVLHPYMSPVVDGIFNTLVQLRLCTAFSVEDVEAGNETASARSDTLPSMMSNEPSGARRAEAERRRALALQALDQRLNATATANRASTAPAPVMSDVDATESPRVAPSVEVAEAPT